MLRQDHSARDFADLMPGSADALQTASHIPNWAIAHVESGFITTQDIVDVIANMRRVDSIFSKDFTELTGTKAVVITA